jgi:hypothetical protein
MQQCSASRAVWNAVCKNYSEKPQRDFSQYFRARNDRKGFKTTFLSCGKKIEKHE